jgi:cell division protein FtsQ
MGVSAPADKRFRRAHVSPARRRARFRLSRQGLVFAGLVAASALYIGYLSVTLIGSTDALTVSRITVTGNARLSRGEVLALVDDLRGRNMLLVGLEQYRQKLLASPWVEDAALRRVLPGTVDVLISERQPLGIARLNDALYLIDQHGGVIDEFGPDNAALDLPLIDGLGVPGGKGDASVDEGRAQLAVRLLAALHARPDLSGRVSQIDVSDSRDAVVMLKGDTAMVRVGDDQFADRLQSYLDLAPALRERVPSIDYVDLRFGERVYVRPQSGPKGH